MNDGQGGQDALEAQKAMESVDAGVVDAAGAMDASSAVDTVEASGVVGTTEASSTIDAAPETNSNGSETSSDGGEVNSEGGKSFSSAFAEKLAVAKEQDEARQALQKKKRLRVIILTTILLILAVAGAGTLIWAFKTGLIASKNPGANEVKDSKVVSPEENGVSQSLRDAANRYAHFLLDGDEDNKKMIRSLRKDYSNFVVNDNFGIYVPREDAREYTEKAINYLNDYEAKFVSGYDDILLKEKTQIRQDLAFAKEALPILQAYKDSLFSGEELMDEYNLGGALALRNKIGASFEGLDYAEGSNASFNGNGSRDVLLNDFYFKNMDLIEKKCDFLDIILEKDCMDENFAIKEKCLNDPEIITLDAVKAYNKTEKQTTVLESKILNRLSKDAQKNAKRLVEAK